MNPKLQEVIKTLQAEQVPSEAIDRIIADISNAASAKLYFELTAVLEDEDWSQLDRCQDQAEADTLIRVLAAKRGSESPEGIVDRFLATFSQTFLDRYALDKAAALATPVEPAPANTPT